MKKHYLIILPLLIIVCACKDGYESPKAVDPKKLNEKIENGIQTKAEWVKTPQSIVKELLPKNVHQEGNVSYSMEEKHLSEAIWKITITEESPIDDEVDGVKIAIDFK